MSTTTSSRVESKTAQKTVNKPGQHRHLTRSLSRKLPQHTNTASERAKSSEPLLATAQPYSFTTPCAPPSHHVYERTCVCIAFGTLLQPPCFSPSRALSPYLLRSPLLLYFALLSRIVLRFFFKRIFFLLHLFSAQKKTFTLCEMWQLSKIREKIHQHTLPHKHCRGP